MTKKSQVGIEYIVIMGFAIMLIMAIMGVAYIYSEGMKDKLKSSQINDFAKKVIASSQEVYYYGQPSKSTISVYLPEGVKNITITNNGIYLEANFYSGYNKMEFISQVPLEGDITTSQGIKVLTIQALDDRVQISQ